MGSQGNRAEIPDVTKPREGRRPGRRNGDLRRDVLRLIRPERGEATVFDSAMAATLGVSEAAVCKTRGQLGIPPAATRAKLYALDYALGPGLAYCGQCIGAWYVVPEGQGAMDCPRGHGRILLGRVRLEILRPR